MAKRWALPAVGAVLVLGGVIWAVVLMAQPTIHYHVPDVTMACREPGAQWISGEGVNTLPIETSQVDGGARPGGNLVDVEHGQVFVVDLENAFSNLPAWLQARQAGMPEGDDGSVFSLSDLGVDVLVATNEELRAECAAARAERVAWLWIPGALVGFGAALAFVGLLGWWRRAVAPRPAG